jgi:preprotein translocase subunit SecA
MEQEAFHNLFRSAASIEAFLKQLQNAPRQLQGGDEGTITESNIARTGGSGESNPSTMPSPQGSSLKINLPKRKPSFDISTSGRNAPCPCGSGKKFKQCCGKEEAGESDQ